MNVLSLSPLYVCCCRPCGTGSTMITSQNPTMKYDSLLGTPNEQGLTPPFPNLAASIYDLNGTGATYGWNTNSLQWI